MTPDGYPDEDELKKIKEWPFMDMHNCMEFIRDRWNWRYDMCPKKEIEDMKRPVMLYKFITGGWSGNEELIGALLENYAGNYYYARWERGGLHEFEIPIVNK